MPITQYNRIREHIKGKEVLDIGFVDHNYKNRAIKDWTHDLIIGDAEKVTGMDILKEDVKRLQEDGYNAIVGNAENFDLDDEFGIIFAGELIEHLSNPGKFLDHSKAHLNQDGKLILTTPNVFGLKYILKNFSPHGLIPNNEHTTYYCQYTLETLLDRHGFDIEEIGFYELHADKEDKNIKMSIWINIIGLFPPRLYNHIFVIAEPK